MTQHVLSDRDFTIIYICGMFSGAAVMGAIFRVFNLW